MNRVQRNTARPETRRLEEARKRLLEILRRVQPHARGRKYQRVSTRGKWTKTSSASETANYPKK